MRTATRSGAVRLATALALAAALPACVTLSRTEEGAFPAPAALRALSQGMALRDVLESCGPPIEAWRQPEGLALVYRARRYEYDRLGLDPSRLLELLPISDLAATALSNLRLTVESGSTGEDRLVLVFDRDDRLTGLAYRGRDGRREP